MFLICLYKTCICCLHAYDAEFKSTGKDWFARKPSNSGATCPSVDLFYYAKPEKIESGVLV